MIVLKKQTAPDEVVDQVMNQIRGRWEQSECGAVVQIVRKPGVLVAVLPYGIPLAVTTENVQEAIYEAMTDTLEYLEIDTPDDIREPAMIYQRGEMEAFSLQNSELLNHLAEVAVRFGIESWEIAAQDSHERLWGTCLM